MNKKKILSLALVVLLICTISFGTLAWFNDTNEITNTFYVATSDDVSSPDSIFSVDVWEEADTDKNDSVDNKNYGQGSDNDNIPFNKILPGNTLTKKPFVKNTGAYPQYIRVKVTFSDASWWERTLNQYDLSTDLTTLLKNIDSNVWTRSDKVISNSTDDTITYTYYLNKELNPSDEAVALFDQVYIPFQFTRQDMAGIGGSFTIHVLAEAVQTENVGNTPQQAFQTVLDE